LQKLQNEIQCSPRELGYTQNLWDGLLLSHHLTKNYSVSLSVRQCQRLFHQLGFSLQRPRRQASEADPLQQETFKKTTTS
jgi:transposase